METRKERGRVRATPEMMGETRTMERGSEILQRHRANQNNFMTPITSPDRHRQAHRGHDSNSSSNSSLYVNQEGLMEVGEVVLVSLTEVEKRPDFAPESSRFGGTCTLAQDDFFNGPRNLRPRKIIPRQHRQMVSLLRKTPWKHARREYRQGHTIPVRQLRQPTSSINGSGKLRSIRTIFYRTSQKIRPIKWERDLAVISF